MKELFQALKRLVESAKAPLFTSFKDDFYRNDKDVILNDVQVGDTWYFGIKACGTYLCLAHNESDFMLDLLSDRHSPERLHFLITVHSDSGFTITEHTFETLRKAVGLIKPRAGRTPNRFFGSELLFGLSDALRGTILVSDFHMTKGAVLYLHLTNNSASYVTNSGKARTIGLPFSLERKVGTYKISINTEFGHGVCEAIKAGGFNRAQKLYLRKNVA